MPVRAADVLPLVHDASQAPPAGTEPAWISESLQDRYGYDVGERLQLPLDGRMYSLYIAGVWRDYVHPGGAIVIEPRGIHRRKRRSQCQ